MHAIEMMFETGRTLAGVAPFFRLFLPLVSVVGTGVLGVLGTLGVVRQRTWALARRGRGGPVEGGSAIVLGVLYLGVAAILFAVLAPVTAGVIAGPR